MKQLIQVLLHAHYLKELDITLSHYTLEFYPELPSVLESLQSLRQLSVSSRDNALEVAKIVSRLRPLERLYLNILGLRPEVAELLQSQSEGLERLTVHQRQITAPATVQFPGLRYLNVDRYPDMALLPRVFPHLTHLHAQDRICLDGGNPHDIRARNLQAQAGSRAWPDLKVYSGGLLSLYMAGLRCSLTRLETRVSRDNTHILKTVLSETCPRALYLRLNWITGVFQQQPLTADEWAKFECLFQDTPEGMSELTLVFTVDVTVTPLEEYLAHIFTMCDPLTIAKLEVQLDAPGPYIAYANGEVDAQGYPRRILRAMDGQSFARQVAERIPTLRVFGLVLPPGLKSEWKIERSHDGRMQLQQVN
ncbi:hypothetical protein OBBRIDRAFT_160722 [Obba rivulosa]|uniref:Uncharacterized protein n=1 Tax=Obba rivulosa TaxID=1052685 RepID=A0A8E2DIZ5_9APHY|nr:hypothetical protein OBBRIDRAFT_160722 [Obba rivulosa]